ISSLHAASNSGVTVATSAALIVIRESGGGLSGNGWVFDVRSTGTALYGTGRSSTPYRRLPGIRSSSNNSPAFVVALEHGIGRSPLAALTRDRGSAVVPLPTPV